MLTLAFDGVGDEDQVDRFTPPAPLRRTPRTVTSADPCADGAIVIERSG